MSGIRVQAPQLQAEILECLKNHRCGKVSEIAKYTGIERTVVWRNCKKLLAEGKLRSTEDRSGVIYSLDNGYTATIADRAAKMVSHGRGRK